MRYHHVEGVLRVMRRSGRAFPDYPVFPAFPDYPVFPDFQTIRSYLVSENFMLTPKSAVVVGNDDCETIGMFFCQSRKPDMVSMRLNV